MTTAMATRTYEVHDICNVYPVMPQNDLHLLGDDIQRHGLLEAIVLYEGKILDGRNRYLAALAVGYSIPEDKFRTFNPETEGNPVEYVASRNHFRRHMTQEDRNAVYIKLRELLKATSPERKRANVTASNRTRGKKDSNGEVEGGTVYVKGTSSDIAAKGAGIGSGTAARIDYVLDHGTEETVTALKDGKVKPGPAYEKTKTERKQGKVLPFPDQSQKVKPQDPAAEAVP